jgi:hypothetical protein
MLKIEKQRPTDCAVISCAQLVSMKYPLKCNMNGNSASTFCLNPSEAYDSDYTE